ncbi:MAG: hypothetical protein ACRDRR_04350 [Pseudonocardiaceae bacterium]
MDNHRLRPLRRAIGSLILVTGSVLLTVSSASAAPMPQATPVTTHATTVLRSSPGEGLAPAREASQDRRLDNGEFVRAGSRTGRGELTIDNGGGQDAVISLATSKNPAFSVYVRNGSKYTVKGIRDGTYEIFFTTGVDWDRQNRTFTRDRTLQRFDDTMKFTTTKTSTEIRWSTWTITLHSVIGGNANSREVNPNDFPAL